MPVRPIILYHREFAVYLTVSVCGVYVHTHTKNTHTHTHIVYTTYISHIFFIHPSVYGHLGCFHSLHNSFYDVNIHVILTVQLIRFQKRN